MTQLASDNFAGTGAMTANWTNVPNGGGPFRRVSDQLAPSNSVNLNFQYWNAVTFPNDQWAELIIKVLAGTTDQGIGPAVRVSNADLTGYFVQANTNETRLYKVISTTYTQLGTDGVACAANDVLRIEVSGTSLTVKKNGAAIIGPVTDNGIASGRAGLWCYDGALGATIRADDWAAGDFAAAFKAAWAINVNQGIY